MPLTILLPQCRLSFLKKSEVRPLPATTDALIQPLAGVLRTLLTITMCVLYFLIFAADQRNGLVSQTLFLIVLGIRVSLNPLTLCWGPKRYAFFLFESAILIAYPIKFLILLDNPIPFLYEHNGYPSDLNAVAVRHTWAVLTLITVSFYLFILLDFARTARHTSVSDSYRIAAAPKPCHRLPADNMRLSGLSTLAIIVTSASDAAIWWFDLYGGGGGMRRYALPFHLEGAVIYCGMIGVPILSLACISLGYMAKQPRLSMVGATCLLFHALVGVACQASKAAFIDLTMTCSVFFAISAIPMRRQRFYTIVIALILAALTSFAVAHQLRTYRLNGLGLGIAVTQMYEHAAPLLSADARSFLTTIFRRITGVDSLLRVMEFVASSEYLSLSELRDSGGSTRFYTRIIRGIPETNPTTAAPSFPGVLYLLGGPWLAFVGVFTYLAGFLMIWRITESTAGLFKYALLAVLSKIAMSCFLEGTVDQALPRQLLVWLAFAAFLASRWPPGKIALPGSVTKAETID